jgi:uncharacterized protein
MLSACWQIMLELAPWLLLGMAVAGLLHVLVPANLIQRHLSGRAGVLKAVLLGVPLPLCSCGVIPAGLGLKKDGASNGAAVGFLIATPQTGVDSIFVSASFLGWPFALFKVGAALVTGLVGGWLTDAATDGEAAEAALPLATAGAHGGLRGAVDHAMEILSGIWRWLVFGVVVSAALTVYLPEGTLASLAVLGTLGTAAAVLAVSVPLYVCATASVPIAAALVAGGMPAGAALIFLMAGPATNLATIGAIYRGLGSRALAVYLSTIIVGSAGFAFAFDFLLEGSNAAAMHHHEHATWWAAASAGVLLALLGWFAFRDVRMWLTGIVARRRAANAPVTEVGVTGLGCNNCVVKLAGILQQTDGVEAVQVELEPGKAVVHGDIDVGRLSAIIEEAGYGVTPPSRSMARRALGPNGSSSR